MATSHYSANIPAEWRGLLESLGSTENPQLLAESWYQENMLSGYGLHPDWVVLFDSLCVQEPTLEKETLIFKPRFVLLPTHVQRGLLTFLLQHERSLPTSHVTRFINSVLPMVEPDSWQYTLMSMLEHSLGQSSASILPRSSQLYKFSSVNSDLASSLCQENRNKKSQVNGTRDNNSLWKHCPQIPSCILQENTGESSENAPMEVEMVRNEIANIAAGSDITGNDIAGSDIAVDTDLSDVIILDEDVCRSTPTKKTKITECEAQNQSKNEGSQSQLLHGTQNTLTESQISEGLADIVLSQEKEETITRLKEIFQNDTECCPPQELDIFLNSKAEEMELVCRKLEFEEMSDITIATVCKHILSLSGSLSFANCQCLLSHMIYERIKEASQKISRTLADAILELAGKFPKEMIESVLVPCVSCDCSLPQSDIVCKIYKEVLTQNLRQHFVLKLMEIEFSMTDSVILIFQTIFDSKVELTADVVTKMLSSIQNSAEAHKKNLKFGKMMLGFVNKYGKQFTSENILNLSSLLDKHKFATKKAVESALKKLKT